MTKMSINKIDVSWIVRQDLYQTTSKKPCYTTAWLKDVAHLCRMDYFSQKLPTVLCILYQNYDQLSKQTWYYLYRLTRSIWNNQQIAILIHCLLKGVTHLCRMNNLRQKLITLNKLFNRWLSFEQYHLNWSTFNIWIRNYRTHCCL